MRDGREDRRPVPTDDVGPRSCLSESGFVASGFLARGLDPNKHQEEVLVFSGPRCFGKHLSNVSKKKNSQRLTVRSLG